MKKYREMTNKESNALFDAQIKAFHDKHGIYPGFTKLAYDDPQVQELWRHARRRLKQSEARLARFRRPEVKAPAYIVLKELQLCAHRAFMVAMLSDGKQYRARKPALEKAWKLAAAVLAQKVEVEKVMGKPVEMVS